MLLLFYVLFIKSYTHTHIHSLTPTPCHTLYNNCLGEISYHQSKRKQNPLRAQTSAQRACSKYPLLVAAQSSLCWGIGWTLSRPEE